MIASSTSQAVATPSDARAQPSPPGSAPDAVQADSTPLAASQPAHAGAPATPASRPAPTPEQRSRWGTMYEGALLDSDNGQDFRESGGYYKLLGILRSYSRDEVSSRTKRFLDWSAAMADPNSWRGEFVRRRGVFIGSRAIRLDRSALGIVDVWRCSIADGDATEGVVFDMLEPPPPELEPGRSAVEIEGLFYRTAHYETHQGYLREAPYLLVKNFRAIRKGEARVIGEFSRTGVALIAAALLFFGFWLALMVRRQARRGAVLHRQPTMKALFEQRLRQAGGAPPGATASSRPPSPVPPSTPPSSLH